MKQFVTRVDRIFKVAILVLFASLISCSAPMNDVEKVSIEELAQNFKTPKPENNVYTWWHWINGNITKDGITKDLEWMKMVGINGAVIFTVGAMDDNIHREVKFRSDEWWSMVEHAEKEADRLGLKLGIHNCDGWSHSGGPWVKPEESMKQLVSTETYISSGTKTITLKKPLIKENFYKDIAILAYPVKESRKFVPFKSVTSNVPGFKKEVLLDEDVNTGIRIAATEKKPVHFTFELGSRQEIAAISIATGEQRIKDCIFEVQTSIDGTNFKEIKRFKSFSKGHLGWNSLGDGASVSLNVDKQPCKYLRLKFTHSSNFSLSNVGIGQSNLIELWEAKSAQIHYTEHGGGDEFYAPVTENWDADNSSSTISGQSVINLTEKLNENDVLDWKPEKGNWKIVRVGYTSTGKTNGPSTVEGRGLETDKLNPALMKKHYDIHMGELVKRAKESNTTSMTYTEIDSWENGVQNWTDGFQDIFKEMRGYDMMPFIPVLVSGQIVDSYEISERFLWDYRRTLSDLIALACFGHLSDLAREDGLKVFAEGSGRQQYLYDPINYNKTADIPKGEFWTGWGEGGANLNHNPGPVRTMRPRIDCKVASSVAHVYGGQLAGSESFTGGSASTLQQGPYDIKMLADKAFAMGINYMVLHTSTHQPYSNLKPGFSLAGAGSHFTRNNPIYENDREWMSYLARCQYLLRQGEFVADVCCFTGDNVPNYLGFRNELSVPLPEGYDYDGINSDIILNHMSVRDGNIVLTSGMEYKVLLLPDDEAMQPKVLAKIEELVKAGATVVGPKPNRSHGLKEYTSVDESIKQTANSIWAKCDGKNIKENSYGEGKVIWGKSFERIFEEMSLIPDFQYAGSAKQMEFNYIHRKVGDADIYFVANGRYRDEQIRASFRVENKVPYFFYPDLGKVVKPAQYEIKDGLVEMPIYFDPAGSIFVVFVDEKSNPSIVSSSDNKADYRFIADDNVEAEFFTSGKKTVILSNRKSHTFDVIVPPSLLLENSWDITFPQLSKDPVEFKNTPLFEWNESLNKGVKYFSGSAVYQGSFSVSSEYAQENIKLYIDLGKVRNLASVNINGKLCAKLWKEPFSCDISNYVLEGENTIEIQVANTLANSFIGDEHLPADMKFKGNMIAEFPDWMKDPLIQRTSGRSTFALRRFYTKDSPLVESGLLGPVTIKASIIEIL